jgi:flagellar protein FliJ
MMARFRFELEAVLEQRLRIERQAQRGVAELEVERLQLEERVRRLQRAIADERADQRLLLQGGQVGEARAQAAAAVRLGGVAQRVVLELSAVHVRLEAARGELLAATKRRKAVEMLRERRLEAWREDENRREAAEMDELAVMQAGRKEEPA